jgi:hypothetical protein
LLYERWLLSEGQELTRRVSGRAAHPALFFTAGAFSKAAAFLTVFDSVVMVWRISLTCFAYTSPDDRLVPSTGRTRERRLITFQLQYVQSI